MNWTAYQLLPIDFRWDHLSTFSEVLAQCQQRDTRALIDPGAHPLRVTTDALREAFEHAQAEARSAGWDGDFRHEAVVFWIPCNEEFKFGFAWKQERNGSTFVVSPVIMSQLEEVCVASSSGEY